MPGPSGYRRPVQPQTRSSAEPAKKKDSAEGKGEDNYVKQYVVPAEYCVPRVAKKKLDGAKPRKRTFNSRQEAISSPPHHKRRNKSYWKEDTIIWYDQRQRT
ncbi:unnamed protein product [Bursaphelenchus okinawaensis]|uniref:Uncharacterized protein n=1 Tax=Bursaphelenchus okinawaensis TaxID=465554 RepID=A0A811KCH7_9BILA|nr:unnamed protein product [Bursaphelenchus okinawaensis]CAG9101670.1 unnamed protein product [Bursaphelenchus okinawaensis]